MTRLPLSRRLAALALFAGLPVAARAAFVKGPYLQDVAQDGVVVSVQLDAESPCTVDWSAGDETGSVTSPSADFHEVALTGLSTGTVYDYRVTCGDDVSDPASFVTAPHVDAPFAFVVMGDTRTDTEAHQGVVGAVLSAVGEPDFYVNTGDLVENGDDGDQWSDFFDIERDLLAGAPFYPVAGNHDDVANDSYYVQFFHLPASDAPSENWYAFRYGNALFVVLDTNEDFVTGSEQADWLEATLDSADADPTIRHVFAFFHHPAYSSGAHGVFDADECAEVRTYIAPVLAEHGVEIVFNGHDHHYERSYPELTDGVTWVVTGAM